MVIALLALSALLLALPVRATRRPGAHGRWAYVTSAALAALTLAVVAVGVVTALTDGRSTWNAWVAGTPHRAGVTLDVIIVGLPTLLALTLVFLAVGRISDRHHARRAQL